MKERIYQYVHTYKIENVAKENDINPKLLRIILYLEIFYRKRIYNQLLQNFICKFMKKLAISKDISDCSYRERSVWENHTK